jgi:spore coat polysaccharide biosynthesis predicted glycosyltransferase SpsG
MRGGWSRTLVVFCDVGPRYGVGHLMRCIALAEGFSARGASVVFAADVGSVPFALSQLRARGFAHVPAPEGVEDHLRVLREQGATEAVIDSYHLPLEVYRAVTETLPTLALVDGDPAGREAHLLVDQNIGAEDDSWTLPAGTVRLAGLDHALMREEILVRRPAEPRASVAEPPRVFAFFGGTDAFGAGPVLTRSLVATGHPFDLRVVAPTPWAEPVEAGPGQRITVIGPTDRLADEVLAADLVISAAGTSSWELLCLGAACGFVCVAENQRTSYGRTVAQGLGLGLGDLDSLRFDAGPATGLLARALTDAQLLAGLRKHGWQRVDGNGRNRVLDAFELLPVTKRLI